MKILMVASELANAAVVGGIAEYLWGLSAALQREGHDVRIALPHYGFLAPDLASDDPLVRSRLPVALGLGASTVTGVSRLKWPATTHHPLALPVYLLGGHAHFSSAEHAGQIYQWPNHEPWVVFNKAVLEWLHQSDWTPDILHCHDAHTAMLPVFLEDIRRHHGAHPLAQTRSILTIHNLLYQGKALPELVAYAGLSMAEWFHIDGFEFYGYTNSFKAGLLHADAVNAVSPSYAREICESDRQGFGLEGVLRRVRSEGRLRGIVNGIDAARWHLQGLHYDGSDKDIETLQVQKEAYRTELYQEWDWAPDDKPVVIFRGRWDTQKGVHLLVEGMEQLLEMAHCVVVTWGVPGQSDDLQALWQQLQNLAQEHPSRLLVNPEGVSRIDEADRHYTLADFVLMPSTYEPCGLIQLESQRYGAIPIVRDTGGLRDTVSEEPTDRFPSPNGFAFVHNDAAAMTATVRRAIHTYRDPDAWREMQRNALLQTNAWPARAHEYEVMYLSHL